MGMLTRGIGKILIITGFFTNSVNSSRVEGFIEEVKQSYPALELLGVQSSSGDEQEVEQILRSTMARVPDLAGVFVACEGQMGVCRAFQQMPGDQRPFVIVYDLVPENIKALEEGWFDFLIDQEGYMQGYRAIRLLSDSIAWGRALTEEAIYTEINIKTKYNL
jgi:LacI family transcriptional regulator